MLAPISEKIKCSGGFLKDVANLAPNRNQELNRKMDLLSQVMELGEKYNLKTLDFKPLKGSPIPVITHEFDAWHDDDGKRVFGYFENEQFVLDKLAKGIGH